MTRPIENCPIEEKPIRERAWTAEQVEAMAADLRDAPGTSMLGTHISVSTGTAVAMYEVLTAFAAVLRQQAERGDGAVSDEARAGIDSPFNACMYRDHCRSMQAALAQNAQGDKPVAWCAGLDATVYGFIDAKAWKEGEFTTPLYLHAERARVPTDAMLAAFVHTWNGGSEWLPSPMNLTKRQLARARKAYDAFLAAAPSQPEDANCSHTWVTDGIGPTRCSKCLKQPEDAA